MVLTNPTTLPFIATLETVQSTLDTLLRVKNKNTPILLVANMVQKLDDVKEAKKIFTEYLNEKLEIISIPYSIGLQTAINENKSVKELAQRKGLQGFVFKKIANSFDNLHTTIKKYIKK